MSGLCLATSGRAVADPAEPRLQPPSSQEPQASGDSRDPTTAFEISLGTTLGGIALIVIGAGVGDHGATGGTIEMVGGIATTVGPSLGHTYAGETWNGGLGLRLIGGTAAVTGAMIAFSACPLFDPCTGSQKSQSDLGGIIAVGGALLYGAGLVYEIGTASAAAREHNAQHQGASFTMSPIGLRTHDGTTPGLGLVGSF